MELKEARAIARRVGATIEVQGDNLLIIRLGVYGIGDNGAREQIALHAPTPTQAARLAVLETAKACQRLRDIAKQVYVDSDLI